MATRRTAAERRAEAAAARARTEAAQWEAFTAQYPVRFAALMYAFMTETTLRVTKLDAETYQFTNPNGWEDVTLKATPPANYDWEYLNGFETLEVVLFDLAAERAEAERRYLAKQAALNKLSKEERELLGLQ